MKFPVIKKIALSAGIVLWGFTLSARDNPASQRNRYSISSLGVYDFGRTFAGRGGIDIAAHMPFHTYVEADAGFEYLSPKILAGTLTGRAKLPLKVGELFVDVSVHMRAFNTLAAGTFALAGSLGYRMEYVSVQLGAQRTQIHSLQKASDGVGSDIVEPLNPIYRIEASVRPYISPWNISLGVGNYTLYQYERLYYPIFFLGGHYDFSTHLSVQAEVDFKPSGIFNLTAHFNELTARAGITYTF